MSAESRAHAAAVLTALAEVATHAAHASVEPATHGVLGALAISATSLAEPAATHAVVATLVRSTAHVAAALDLRKASTWASVLRLGHGALLEVLQGFFLLLLEALLGFHLLKQRVHLSSGRASFLLLGSSFLWLRSSFLWHELPAAAHGRPIPRHGLALALATPLLHVGLALTTPLLIAVGLLASTLLHLLASALLHLLAPTFLHLLASTLLHPPILLAP
jgi:hypothetical protein